MSYRCATCGRLHEGLPDVAFGRPDHWWDVPEAERERRIYFTADTCVIDDEDFFIRGVIEIPVHDYAEKFGFGIWVSQKRENFITYLENYDSSEIGPFFGWLCNRIRYYEEDTLYLKTMAHFRGGTLRPSIEIEPTTHPLSLDQRRGISLDKAWEIAHYYGDKSEESA